VPQHAVIDSPVKGTVEQIAGQVHFKDEHAIWLVSCEVRRDGPPLPGATGWRQEARTAAAGRQAHERGEHRSCHEHTAALEGVS
jgi:hypothetical protein